MNLKSILESMTATASQDVTTLKEMYEEFKFELGQQVKLKRKMVNPSAEVIGFVGSEKVRVRLADGTVITVANTEIDTETDDALPQTEGRITEANYYEPSQWVALVPLKNVTMEQFLDYDDEFNVLRFRRFIPVTAPEGGFSAIIVLKKDADTAQKAIERAYEWYNNADTED